MADRPNSKPDSKSSNIIAIEYIIIAFIVIFLINSFIPVIENIFKSKELTFYGLNLFNFFGFFEGTSSFFKFVSVSISILFVGFIFVTNYKSAAVMVAGKKLLYPETAKAKIGQGTGKSTISDKWQIVLEHLNSSNPNDWKLSIIEADVMLGELLDSMSYNGETIGEKLKGVEKSDFLTIDKAWEAHKVRNTVAHQGSDFILSERETRRIIDLYKSVFKEFHII